MLWIYEENTRNFWGGGKHIRQLNTFFLTVPCSSLQLWIAVLTRLADSMWQLVISRKCTSKHDLCEALKPPLSGCCRSTTAPCPLYGLPWGGLVSTGRSVTSVDVGVRMWVGEEERILTNETSLSVSGPYQLAVWKMCLCAHESNRNYMSGSA